MEMQAFPILLAIEFAKTLGFIDPERIAVSAHSLGTAPLAMLALLSEDIKTLQTAAMRVSCRSTA